MREQAPRRLFPWCSCPWFRAYQRGIRMIQKAEETGKFGWDKAALTALLPLLLSACQSTPPSELASDLAEPAVVTATANPTDAAAPDVFPAPRPLDQPASFKPRALASVAPRRIEAAIEVQELRAPKRAP